MGETTLDRRRFFGSAAVTLAASQLGLLQAASAEGETTTLSPQQSAAHTSFGPLKSVDAGVLRVGYAEAGPANGTVVILLHGWPYDIHSYVDVAPALASAGYRVLVPYLRGYGSTHFLSSATPRSGQPVVVAADILAFMDALKIKRAIIAGFDWGARTANVMSALWPERCKATVSVSGYLITNLATEKKPLPPRGELGWWYQYYFSTERGRLGYSENRHDFNKLIWQIVSPKWNFDDATFDRTAKSFENPDHVDIVIHNYRWRLGLAKSDPKFEHLEAKLQARPTISVPTITIGSDFDGANAGGAAYAKLFTGKYSHVVLNGIGHNVPQEAPLAFAKTIVDVDRY